MEPFDIEGVVLLGTDKMYYAVRRDGAGEITSWFCGVRAECEFTCISAAVNFAVGFAVGNESSDRPGLAVVETKCTVHAANLSLLTGGIG